MDDRRVSETTPGAAPPSPRGCGFKALNRPRVNPIPKQLPADQMPVVMGARGDYVWLIFEHEDKDPRNPANTYHYNSFDILRVQNGKAQEHWDSAQKVKGS